ncbi:hypothetical protein D3C78_1564290 [compost metagenome]
MVANDRQGAAIFGDAENGQNAGGAVAGVEEAAIRREVDIRRPTGAVEIGRHDIQRLRQGVFSAVFTDGQHVYRAVQLVDAVGKFVVRVECHVARASTGGGCNRFLSMRRQFTLLIQIEQTNAIFFQARHQQQLIGRIDIGRVRRC